jgi:hypothetical protein
MHFQSWVLLLLVLLSSSSIWLTIVIIPPRSIRDFNSSDICTSPRCASAANDLCRDLDLLQTRTELFLLIRFISNQNINSAECGCVYAYPPRHIVPGAIVFIIELLLSGLLAFCLVVCFVPFHICSFLFYVWPLACWVSTLIRKELTWIIPEHVCLHHSSQLSTVPVPTLTANCATVQ